MKRSRLKPISSKRKEQLKQYKILRAQYLKENPVCQVCEKASATEIHHREPGRGSRTNDVALFVSICSQCHRRIHQGEQYNGVYKYGPKWARENGWLV